MESLRKPGSDPHPSGAAVDARNVHAQKCRAVASMSASQPHVTGLAHRNMPAFQVVKINFGDYQCSSGFDDLCRCPCVRAARRQESDTQVCSCERSVCPGHRQGSGCSRRIRQGSQQASMEARKDAIQTGVVWRDNYGAPVAQLLYSITKSLHCGDRH